MSEHKVKKCSCGYKVKGVNHESGEHHRKTKAMKPHLFRLMNKHGKKTNVGDPKTS